MLKKILLGILIIACIVVGIYWFLNEEKKNEPISNGINAVPLDAAFIFESKQAIKTWEKLKGTAMWQELLGTETGNKLNSQILYIDSLLKTSPQTAELLNKHSLFISAHCFGTNSVDFLYVYSLPDFSYQSNLSEFLKSIHSDKQPVIRNYDNTEIEVIYPQNKDSLNLSFIKGILLMSTKQVLIEDAIRQLKSGISFLDDKNFTKVTATTGKIVDANLYINFKKIPNLLNYFATTDLHKDITDLTDFADYSGWDISLKQNYILLNGFTQANDSSNNFLGIFTKQKPQEIEFTKIIPSKTAFFLWYGASDIKAFHRKYKTYLNYKQRSQQYEQFINETNKKYKVNIERSFLDWISNEIAFIITDPSATSIADNSYAVIRANSIKEALLSLNALADSVCKKDNLKKDTTQFKDYVITHLPLSGALPRLLGWQFEKINTTYFTGVNGYVIFATTITALKNFIADFENNKTLEKDKNYRSFMEDISGEATVYLYASTSRLLNSTSLFLNKNSTEAIKNNQDRFSKFDKVGIQFSTNKNLYYSNVCLHFNSSNGNDLKPEWEIKLDTTFHAAPYAVKNFKTKTKDVLVKTDKQELLLITKDGKINWKRLINEPIISSLLQPENKREFPMQVLFNSSDRLFKIDEKGKNSKGFPVKFKVPATSPITIINYDKGADYRIFVAFKDLTIRCFNNIGAEVNGFDLKTDNIVTLPVQHTIINNKDFLFTVDTEGKIYITDRRGQPRLKLKERLPQQLKQFYIEAGTTFQNSYLIAADSTGKVVRISLDDNKEQFRLKHFGSNVTMEYADINSDGSNEYIFADKKQISVYSQQKKLIFDYPFQNDIQSDIVLFHHSDGSIKIGAVAPDANRLFLLNNNGTAVPNFPVKGNTSFIVDDLDNNGNFYIITGTAENTIAAYPLE